MAHYHLSVKVLSRSTRNMVFALAYRAGTDLLCARTGESFDYTNKVVDNVELLLPKTAPQWSVDLQKEILDNLQKGLQKLSNRVESAEKRIDIESQMKKGKAVTERLKKGLSSFVGEEAEKIQARNFFRLNLRPELVFDIVTKNHSTFQWADVQKVLHRYADSIDTFDRLNAQLSGSKKIVALADEVYTTKSLFKIEYQTEEDLLVLKDRHSRPVETSVVAEVLKAHDEKLQAHGGLTAQQKAVIEGLVEPERVKTLVGYAGTGKSTSLALRLWALPPPVGRRKT